LKIEESILKVLAYFDMFNYPVTQEEITLYCSQPTTVFEINSTLQKLCSENLVYLFDNFYTLQNNRSLIDRRKTGNKLAENLLYKGKKIGSLFYKFPFVRAVGISGSVSKNFADEESDIDYFIITKANRLWIARTFLHLFKKLPFLKGRNKWYCMNYFIDEDLPVIEEKNIYTATELITLIPVAGNETMSVFFTENKWAYSFFPNCTTSEWPGNTSGSSWLKRFTEFLLNNNAGNRLDNYFLKLTTKRWNLKETKGKLNTKGEFMGLKTSKHCSKPSPVFFHDIFLKNYEQKINELIARSNL